MQVTPYYDSLLAKLMVFAEDRAAAIAKMVLALDNTKVGRKTSCRLPVLSSQDWCVPAGQELHACLCSPLGASVVTVCGDHCCAHM